MKKGKTGRTLRQRRSIRGHSPVVALDQTQRLSAVEMARLNEYFVEQTGAPIRFASTPSGGVNVFSDLLGDWP